MFAEKKISFKLIDTTHTYRFDYLFITRTDKKIEEFFCNPEALSLIARWDDPQNPGRFRGLYTQFYYKTSQMKEKLGLIIKPLSNAVLNEETVSIHKKYPFLSPQEKVEKQEDETYLRVYAGKQQHDLDAALLKQVEMEHRNRFEAPDLSTKETLLSFLHFCDRYQLNAEIEEEDKLDINKILLYLETNDYKILHEKLLEKNLLSLLDKEEISHTIKDKFKADEAGYVSYGILPPVIRFQIKQVLEELQAELGNQFTLEEAIATLEDRLEKRAKKKRDEIIKNNFLVPTYNYVRRSSELRGKERGEEKEGIEKTAKAQESHISFGTAYASPSPEEYRLLKNNPGFKTRTLGSTTAHTKQPVPGFNVAAPGYIVMKGDQEGKKSAFLLPSLQIVGQLAAEGQENAFYPTASFRYFQMALDPLAMFERSDTSELALKKLNFFFLRTIDGLGGSFSFERDRLTFVTPINGDENAEQLALLEKKVRESFGLKDNYYLRDGFPKINPQRKIAGTGDTKLTQPYYSFDFNIGPDYFFNKVLTGHLQEMQIKAQQVAREAESKDYIEEKEIAPSEIEQRKFRNNLKQLAISPLAWKEIIEYCKKYKTEAYTTIADDDHLYETPLHWVCYAAMKGKITKAQLLEFLRLPGVAQHINIENGWGYTPLHEAIIRKAPPEIIQLLLDFGANPNSLTTEPYQVGKPPYEARRYSVLDVCIGKRNAKKLLEEKILKTTSRAAASFNFFNNEVTSIKHSFLPKEPEPVLTKEEVWIEQILRENGAQSLTEVTPRGDNFVFYTTASHCSSALLQTNPKNAWVALLSQRCASVILTDKEQNIVNVDLGAITNAIYLAEQHNVSIIQLILPDTSLNQGIQGMSLLQIACRKGQGALAHILLLQLKKELSNLRQEGSHPPYYSYIEKAFKELDAFSTTNKKGAGTILWLLLEEYSDDYPHFTPDFQKLIRDLTFKCSAETPELQATFHEVVVKNYAAQAVMFKQPSFLPPTGASMPGNPVPMPSK
ncbi:MAG: Ankyrin repeat (3 copies) [Gammaproteobacteria bacterium]|jgi:hypothetical protein|nr:Ankyrin repeat (3 copies) [Gammaproteobacteria bacterium]